MSETSSTEPSPVTAASPAASFVTPLRIAALAEAVSYLVLLGCVVAKNAFDAANEGGVPVVGPIHGIIFLAYLLLVLLSRREQRWSLGQTLMAVVASAIPFGGFYVERRMITSPTAPGSA